MKIRAKCDDQRQHLSLSKYAFETVKNDSINFMGKKNISGFINRIVENTMVDSFKDIILAEEERIKTEFGKKSISQEEKETINKIAKIHKNYVLRSRNKYPKDVAIKIRLNRKAYKKLYANDWDGYDEDNDITPGEYIKFLVEEYARKTMFQREAIFYKEIIEEINRYANKTSDDNCIITFSLTSNNNKFYLKPYRLSEEYEANYHYLIGLSSIEGKENYEPTSVRLSRIVDLDVRSKSFGSGRLTKKEIRELDAIIEAKGIPYMRSPVNTYVVDISAKGMNMYNGINEQRPVYDDMDKHADGSCTLTITATDMQITNYFFQFRELAQVVSPEGTRNRLKDWYYQANETYKKQPS